MTFIQRLLRGVSPTASQHDFDVSVQEAVAVAVAAEPVRLSGADVDDITARTTRIIAACEKQADKLRSEAGRIERELKGTLIVIEAQRAALAVLSPSASVLEEPEVAVMVYGSFNDAVKAGDV